MGYRARNGKWYSHKESEVEYNCRRINECIEDNINSASNDIRDTFKGADSITDIFWGLLIAAFIWVFIIF